MNGFVYCMYTIHLPKNIAFCSACRLSKISHVMQQRCGLTNKPQQRAGDRYKCWWLLCNMHIYSGIYIYIMIVCWWDHPINHGFQTQDWSWDSNLKWGIQGAKTVDSIRWRHSISLYKYPQKWTHQHEHVTKNPHLIPLLPSDVLAILVKNGHLTNFTWSKI